MYSNIIENHLFPANVMEDIFCNTEPVEYHAEEKRALADYKKKAIFNADFKTQDKLFIYIIYGCGLRRQEASAEKITGLTAHVFRHNYCTNLCCQIPAVSIKKIAQLTGDTEAVMFPHIRLRFTAIKYSGTPLFSRNSAIP